jgi:hypothetical protein
LVNNQKLLNNQLRLRKGKKEEEKEKNEKIIKKNTSY